MHYLNDTFTLLTPFWTYLTSLDINTIAKFVWLSLSAIFFIFTWYILLKIHKNPLYRNFNLIDLFIDSDTNKVSSSKFMLIISFMVTTWAFIQITIFSGMTAEYMTIYIGAFVFNNLTNRYINKTPPVSGPDPIQEEDRREHNNR